MPTRKFLVSGRVQGVGFRWFTRSEALGLGLSGWARNLKNGSVEVLVDGSKAALSKMASSLSQGPPASKVDSVGQEEGGEKVNLGFEILPNA